MLISAGNIISASIKLYRDNAKLFLQYMGILFIPTAINGVLSIFATTPSMGIVYFVVAIAAAVVTIWISIAFVKTLANKYDSKTNLPIQEELQKSTELILPAILVSILTGLAVLGGLILLIIPGIIFAVWFAFAFYILVLENKRGVEAMKASKKMVEGRWFAVLWRLLAPGIVFAILAGILQAIAAAPLAAMGETTTSIIIVTLLTSAAALLITPLTTAAPTILYLELKKTPLKK